MFKEIQDHEKWVEDQIKNPTGSYFSILKYHERQIQWLQHERLVHLLVTILIAVSILFSCWILLTTEFILAGVLFLILTVLCVFYILHYYRLENAVQRWYVLYKQLWLLAGKEGNDRETS